MSELRRERQNKLSFEGICPYFKETKGLKRNVCECAKFTFPDKAARREILYGLCGHPSAWQNCRMKKAMDNYYYERKFKKEGS